MTSSGQSSRKLFEHELEERLDAVLFASPSHRSITRLAATLESLTRAQQEKVLHWAGVAAKTYAEIGYLLATLAPEAFELLDEDGFDAWVLSGLDAYDRFGLRPAMDQLRNIELFRAERAGTAVTRLADVELRLARFVQGLSGRPLAVRSGQQAWTDTESIFLPELVAVHTSPEANRRLYKAMAALLWAQTRHGTFSIDLEARLAEWPDRQRALGWLAALEAVRLDARIAAELPGLAAEIADERGPWPEELSAAVVRLSRSEATVSDSLDLLAGLMAGDAVPPRLTFVGTLDPAAAWRMRAERIQRDTETLKKALAALKGMGGRRPTGEHAVSMAIANDGAGMGIRVDGEAEALPPDAQAAAQSLIQDLGEVPPEALTPAGHGQWTPLRSGGAGADRSPRPRIAVP